MTPSPSSERPDSQSDPADPDPVAPALSQVLRALRDEAVLAIHDRVHLVTLEVRQVGIRATQMVLLATLAALFLCSAWATVLVAIYMACIEMGMRWWGAMLMIVVLNLAAAGGAWYSAHGLSSAFTFPATRRMIRAFATKTPPAP
ncbi:MAG: phage holin family protein [Acidobacteriota bacterium]